MPHSAAVPQRRGRRILLAVLLAAAICLASVACQSGGQPASAVPLPSPDTQRLVWLHGEADGDAPPRGTANGSLAGLAAEADAAAGWLDVQHLADTAFHGGDWQTAAHLYGEALARGMTDASALTRLGIAVQADDPARAAGYFELAIEQDAAQWDARFYLAACRFRLGQIEDRVLTVSLGSHAAEVAEVAEVREGALNGFHGLIELQQRLRLPVLPAAVFNRGVCRYLAGHRLVARQDFIRCHESGGPAGPFAARALHWIQHIEDELALSHAQRYVPTDSAAFVTTQ